MGTAWWPYDEDSANWNGRMSLQEYIGRHGLGGEGDEG